MAETSYITSVTLRRPTTSTWVGWVAKHNHLGREAVVVVGCTSLIHPTRSIEGFPTRLEVAIPCVIWLAAS